MHRQTTIDLSPTQRAFVDQTASYLRPPPPQHWDPDIAAKIKALDPTVRRQLYVKANTVRTRDELVQFMREFEDQVGRPSKRSECSEVNSSD
jgi:hypothetical protein